MPLQIKQLAGIQGSNNSSWSSVPVSTTSVQLLAANPNRTGFTLYNGSTSTLYLLLNGAAASLSKASLPINAGGYYEVPCCYAGAVTGIWNTADASGSAWITEFF